MRRRMLRSGAVRKMALIVEENDLKLRLFNDVVAAPVSISVTTIAARLAAGFARAKAAKLLRFQQWGQGAYRPKSPRRIEDGRAGA